MERGTSGLFSALLRHWRQARQMSQLALSLESEVSTRHLSFLETGRAKPGREMVLRLGTALSVPRAEQNAMLRAAGFDPEFEEPSLSDGFPEAIRRAVDRMKHQQEPFPLLVMDEAYDLLDLNAAAVRLFQAVAPKGISMPRNTLQMIFEPGPLRDSIVGWEGAAQAAIQRLQRESLAHPGNVRLSKLLDTLLSTPGVPAAWAKPALDTPSEPVFTVRLRFEGGELAFFSVLTVFSAPQNPLAGATLVESYFPLDAATEALCAQLAAG